MSGNKAGGKKAAQTNKERYGENFYSTIGQKGGVKSTTGGFFADRELARRAGALGGRKSKRGKNKIQLAKDYFEDLTNETR